jgi:antitoxin component of RelBE/YafQ-DinJ toxin-antitoxin module
MLMVCIAKQHRWLQDNTFIFETHMYNVPTSTTRSFRVDTELAKVLDEESERMGVSVNALVNMMLKRYSEFTRFLSKIDLVVINRELLKSLFDSYPDADIYGLGVEIGEIIPRDTILFWKKTLTFETIIEYIEKIICRYGFLGTYDETTQNDKKIIVIRHRLGQKGSQFLHGYLKSTLKSTLNLDSSFELTESSVKLQINN